MEASKGRIDEYQESIKDIAAEKLVYIDESGIDISPCKDKGWGKKGQVPLGKKSGKYYQRTNIVAGYVNKKSIARMVFNSSCATHYYSKLGWEEFLIKELEPGQVVVMDNASFHNSQKIRELIESTGCELISLPPFFLPPYCPNLNPIEKFWANMKR